MKLFTIEATVAVNTKPSSKTTTGLDLEGVITTLYSGINFDCSEKRIATFLVVEYDFVDRLEVGEIRDYELHDGTMKITRAA